MTRINRIRQKSAIIITAALTASAVFGHLAWCASAPDAKDAVTLKSVQITSENEDRTEYAVHIAVKEDFHIYGNVLDDPYLIPTKLEPVPASAAVEVIYPKPLLKNLAFLNAQVPLYEGEVVFRVIALTSKGEKPGLLLFTYQPCSDKACFSPSSIKIDLGIYAAAEPSKATPSLPAASSAPANPFGGKGLLVRVLLVFLLGLGLNLTPCVYPMIPVTISYFGAQEREGSKSILALCSVFVAGLSITFASFGAAAALSGKTFGTLLRNDATFIILGAVFFTLSLSMFGLFEIRLSGWILGRLSRKGGYAGAFFMGAVLGFVGAPCTGPLLIALLAYVGSRKNALEGFILFLFTGIGLGLPYLVLGYFSAQIKKLPRSGAWMVWIKKIFGLAMLYAGLYFMLPLMSQRVYDAANATVSIISAVVVLFFRKDSTLSGSAAWIRRVFISICICAAVFFIFSLTRQTESVKWIPYSEQALTGTGTFKITLIDFYASWCAPCRAMEKEVFSSKEVIALSGKVRFIKVDLSIPSDAGQAVSTKYGINGVPALVLLAQNGAVIEKIDGFTDKDTLVEKLINLLQTTNDSH